MTSSYRKTKWQQRFLFIRTAAEVQTNGNQEGLGSVWHSRPYPALSGVSGTLTPDFSGSSEEIDLVSRTKGSSWACAALPLQYFL